MDEHEERASEMLAQHQQTRQEFLTAELSACFDAVNEARVELQSGHREAAEKHLQTAEKGYEIIVRSLADLEDEQQRASFQNSWDALRAELDELQARFKENA